MFSLPLSIKKKAAKEMAEVYSRIDRLVGDSKRDPQGLHGGGLPLADLFAIILNALLDFGSRSIEELAGSVEKALAKPERIKFIYAKQENAHSLLVVDALEQLETRAYVKRLDRDNWELRDHFPLRKSVVVIPKRAGRNQSITITIFPKEERDRLNANSRDQRELKAMYSDLRNDRLFNVKVGARQKQFRLHPLARKVPQLPEKDFMGMAEDIKQHGVRVPLVIYEGMILDGRHRIAIASALQLPVVVNEFQGTEQDAIDLVVSMNVMRRHLTMAQRTLLVMEILLPEAKREAAERQQQSGEQSGRGMNRLASNDANLTEGKKAVQIAADRSNGLTTATNLERMKAVADAPKTKEKIQSGEIKTVAEAKRSAEEETGESTPDPETKLFTAYDNLGKALQRVRRACEVLESNGLKGESVPNEKLLNRIEEIRTELTRAEELLKEEAR